MDYTVLIKETGDYVETFMNNHDLSKFRFHNGIHIKQVKQGTELLADYYKLNEQDSAVVILPGD